MRFFGLKLGEKVPDSKTIWLFRENFSKAGIVKNLFTKFDSYLRDHGFKAMKGQIIDASIVSVPKQRNSREETNYKLGLNKTFPLIFQYGLAFFRKHFQGWLINIWGEIRRNFFHDIADGGFRAQKHSFDYFPH